MKQNFSQSLSRINDSTADSDTIDLGALASVLWRGKWLISIITFIAIAIGGYYAFIAATPLYEATSVVILETQQQQVVDLQSVMGGLTGDSSEVNSEVEVLRSRGLMEKVARDQGLLDDPEFNTKLLAPSFTDKLKSAIKGIIGASTSGAVVSAEDASRIEFDGTVDTLIQKVSVRNIPQSYVFRITVETESAAKSARIADSIAKLYILNQLDVKFEATQQATKWLADRVAELKVELENAEAKVSAFNSGTDLINAETLQALERQLKELRDRIVTARAATKATVSKASAIEAVRNASRAEKAAATGDAQLKKFLARLSASDDAAIGQAFDTRFDQVAARAALEASRARAQFKALENSAEELNKQISRQNDDLITLQQLTREAEASKALYEYFLGRLKETSAQQGIQKADSRILSNAVVPLSPSAPRKSLILAMSGILGLMLGAGLVLILEMRQNTFRTARELEKLTGYTVMGQIPLLPTKRRKDALSYLSEKPTSAAAEAVRNLRTSILLSNLDNPPKVIMSTSSLPGEGKTTVSLALAQNLVGMGKKVLLVEGDIRRRIFGQYMNTDQKNGLLAVLSGENTLDDVILHDDRIGADILIGEHSNTNAADIFSSDRFKSFMNDVRDIYDFVVIDTPPVLVVPDARVIAQSVDAILFTVRWDLTSKSQVEESIRMFESVGQEVTGLVLNQISDRGMKRYGYGGQYGAYSSYGKKYYNN